MGNARLALLGIHPRAGPPILVTQQEASVFPPAGNDRRGGPVPRSPKLMLLGIHPRAGPPILLTQTEQSAFPTEGNSRLGGYVLPGAAKPILLGGKNRQGPPILLATQQEASTFPPAGSDRLGGTVPQSPRLRLGRRWRIGPPILVTQQRSSIFQPAGSDRFIDAPLTHPILKFAIGRRGKSAPPILLATQVQPSPRGGPGVSGSVFPVQYDGLYFRKASGNVALCLVAEADAPAGMGGVLKIRKGGVNYALYLVETTDPNASPVYVRTSAGTKSIRLKT